MKRFGHVLVLACLLLLPARQAAGEWTADVVDTEWFPGRSVAVDKRAQSFFLLTRQSPLRVADFIPCATGQLLGDKSKEGDLRTPEGVYFITRRKAGGLNYELYGDLAFPLNFPNPADVVRKKTGHGIWIHGRGHAIIPYETQGCVAVNTPDLHRLDTELALGTPVIIADELRLDADARQIRSEAREVVEATKNWAKAWQDRSDAFFDFHDPEKFAITEGQAFATFRSQKERLFKSLPWIQVTLSDLRALPGPDYWVTFFVQLYRSPTLISQGIKRLYWQRGTDGRFRIIGMEYEEMPVTVADRGTAKPAALANEAETATARTDAPSEEETQARQLVDAHQAAMEKMAHKAFHALPITRQPTPEDQAILEVAETGPAKPGVSPFASDALRVAAEPPQLPPVPGPKPAAVPTVPAAPVKEAAPVAASSPVEKAAAAPAAAPVVASTPAPAVSASPAPAAVPTPPGPTPVAAPAAVPAAPVQLAEAAPPAPPVVQPAPPAPTVAAVPAQRAAEIRAVVEAWRVAWESGRLDDYLAHYTDGAVQGSLKGKAAIGRQKSGLWQGHAPGRVTMDVLAVAAEGDGFTAVCAMRYQGKGSKESDGFKTLRLVPSGGKLLISQERWSKNRPTMPPASLLAAAPAEAPAPLPAPVSSASAAPAAQPAVAQSAAPAPPAGPAVAPAPVPPAPAAPTAAAQSAAAAKADRAAAATAMVEAWRSAWERGRVVEYASYYAAAAVQGDRRGRDAIRDQKADLWKEKAPKSVRFSDLKVVPRRDGFVVTFVQDYESRDGGSDRGKKTLSLAPAGTGFAIVEEKWSRL